MQIVRGLHNLRLSHRGCVATVGNFDGVHLGHAEILRRVVRHARSVEGRSMLLTFDPHPAAVVAPERVPRLLQTRRQKLDRLVETGISDLAFLPFTPELAALSGEDFLFAHLLPRVPLAAIHVGAGFRFGVGRSGDVELLRAIGGRVGFSVHAVEPLRVEDDVVSSSAVRRAVSEGDVVRATALLGRPYAVTGLVVQGAGRGRTLEYPTANVAAENELLPPNGVYITETAALAGRHPSLTNVGVRPTFGGRELVVETHLLDFSRDLYSERIEVRFLARLRDEIRFRGPLELGDQLARDRAAAEAYFQSASMRAE